MSRLDGYRTLLLDSTFRPMKAIGWKRAMILDIQDRVDILEYYDQVVRTPTTEYPLPAVVRLRQYLRLMRRGAPFTRRNVLLRDQFTCQYCARTLPPRDLTLDHVVPRSRGGRMVWENVVAACRRCNHQKGNRTPEEARMLLPQRPERPLFLPVSRQPLLIGETPPEWDAYLKKSA